MDVFGLIILMTGPKNSHDELGNHLLFHSERYHTGLTGMSCGKRHLGFAISIETETQPRYAPSIGEG